MLLDSPRRRAANMATSLQEMRDRLLVSVRGQRPGLETVCF